MDQPTVLIMKKLISKYNKSLKISNYSKLKKNDINNLVKKNAYYFNKNINGDWDLSPRAEMKRQKQLTYNKKTKKTTEKTYRR